MRSMKLIYIYIYSIDSTATPRYIPAVDPNGGSTKIVFYSLGNLGWFAILRKWLIREVCYTGTPFIKDK